MDQENQILKLVETTSSMNAQLQTVIKTLDDVKEQLASVGTLAQNDEQQNKKIKELENKIKDLEERVKKLEETPGQHALAILKTVLKYVGTLALGGIVTAVFFYIKTVLTK